MKVCEEPLFKGFWLPTLLYHVNIVHTLPCTQCTLATMFTSTILYLVFVPTLPCGNCTMYIHYPVLCVPTLPCVLTLPVYSVYPLFTMCTLQIHYLLLSESVYLYSTMCKYTTMSALYMSTLYIQITIHYPLYHMSLYIHYCVLYSVVCTHCIRIEPTFPSLYGGSLEITLTDPIILSISFSLNNKYVALLSNPGYEGLRMQNPCFQLHF